jgi:quaternary ammonium compound-resistance protein SugE
MAWLYLILASVFEVVLAVGTKKSEGFTKLTPSVVTVVAVVLAMYMLGQATKPNGLPISLAYPIWTGIGASGTIIYGMLYLNEPVTALRFGLLCVVVAAIAGLYATSPDSG